MLNYTSFAAFAAKTRKRHLNGAGLLLAGPVLRLHPLFGGEEALRGLLIRYAAARA